MNRTSVSSPSFFPALVLIGIFILLLALLMPAPSAPLVTPTAPTELPTVVAAVPTEIPPTEVAAEAPAAYSAEMISAGSNSFQTICAACHGFNARGIPGLGKDLLASEFVHSRTDEELLQFIIIGREASDPLNTTGVMMPARGGNLAVTDEQILNIIAYLRSEAVDSVVVAQPTTVAAQPTAVPTQVAVQPTATLVPQQSPTPAPTREPVTPQPFSAETAFVWSCSGCHGADGNGNEPFGPGFMESELLDDDAAMLVFLTESQPPADPALEFPHPVRGGYPVLSDEQLSELIDYMEGLRTGAAGS